MLELMIGAASFFCGFAIMFAIHRVIFDYYDEDAKKEIYDLKCEVTALKGEVTALKGDKFELKEVHTFATPDDVTNIEF